MSRLASIHPWDNGRWHLCGANLHWKRGDLHAVAVCAQSDGYDDDPPFDAGSATKAFLTGFINRQTTRKREDDHAAALQRSGHKWWVPIPSERMQESYLALTARVARADGYVIASVNHPLFDHACRTRKRAVVQELTAVRERKLRDLADKGDLGGVVGDRPLADADLRRSARSAPCGRKTHRAGGEFTGITASEVNEMLRGFPPPEPA